MKASFPLYVALPCGYLILRSRKSAFRASNVAAFVIVVALFGGPWYAANANRDAEDGKIYQTGDVFSFLAMGQLLSNIANRGAWGRAWRRERHDSGIALVCAAPIPDV
jgi:peptidoglycan/LPS O-acetylase OafA/YrhL